MKNNLVWVIGGAQSGKTQFAEQTAAKFSSVVHFGTARPQQPGDELALQIASLKQKRPSHWKQFDAPFTFEDLKREGQQHACVVLDCLTMWLAWNLTDAHLKYAPEQLRAHVTREFDYLLDVLVQLPCAVIVVSGEVGSGVVPSQPSGRWFREIMGKANLVANQKAGFVVQVVAGNALLVRSGVPRREPTPVHSIAPEWLCEQLARS